MRWDAVVSALDTWKLGDIASVAGLIVALVGFAATIWNVRGSKKASHAASEAVAKVREDLRRIKTVTDFSNALTSMEDIKRLHRDEAWKSLPERYSSLRRTLIAIREDRHSLSDDEKSKIQSAISKLSTLEEDVDQHFFNEERKLDVPKINSVMNTQIDQLNAVLVRLRDDVGKDK